MTESTEKIKQVSKKQSREKPITAKSSRILEQATPFPASERFIKRSDATNPCSYAAKLPDRTRLVDR